MKFLILTMAFVHLQTLLALLPALFKSIRCPSVKYFFCLTQHKKTECRWRSVRGCAGVSSYARMSVQQMAVHGSDTECGSVCFKLIRVPDFQYNFHGQGPWRYRGKGGWATLASEKLPCSLFNCTSPSLLHVAAALAAGSRLGWGAWAYAPISN